MPLLTQEEIDSAFHGDQCDLDKLLQDDNLAAFAADIHACKDPSKVMEDILALTDRIEERTGLTDRKASMTEFMQASAALVKTTKKNTTAKLEDLVRAVREAKAAADIGPEGHVEELRGKAEHLKKEYCEMLKELTAQQQDHVLLFGKIEEPEEEEGEKAKAKQK